MSDLFDGVKLPREERREAPQAAAAPAPARETASTPEAKPTGVRAARLWLWAAPLLLVVTAIALWAISPWLLLAVGAAVVLGGIVSGLAWLWIRHRRPGRSARTGRSWTPGASAVHTGRGGRFSRGGRSGHGSGRGLGFGGRSTGRNPGRGGSAGPNERRTRPRWNPFGGPSGRGRNSAGRPTGGQAAGVDGRGARNRAGRLRSLFSPGRRSAAASGGAAKDRAATGRAGGGRRTRGSQAAAQPAAAGGRPGTRWSRSRANPAVWRGPIGAAVRAASKRERKPKDKTKSEAGTKPEAKGTDTTATESKRRWWPWRRKKQDTKDAPDTKTTAEATKTAGEAATSKSDPPKANQASGPKAKKGTDKPSPTPQPKNKPEATPVAPKAKAERVDPQAATASDVIVLDEWGFPTRPNPAPRQPPRPHNAGRFKPSPVVTPTATKAPTATKGKTMSDRISNPYAHLIDSSTNATFRATTEEAAKQARADAGKLEQEAGELRAQAQSWIEKGSNDIAQPLLAEAARKEADATNRYAAAAAYESVPVV
jgi:hypothetical protein